MQKYILLFYCYLLLLLLLVLLLLFVITIYIYYNNNYYFIIFTFLIKVVLLKCLYGTCPMHIFAEFEHNHKNLCVQDLKLLQ